MTRVAVAAIILTVLWGGFFVAALGAMEDTTDD